MKCLKCNKDWPEAAKFCGNCGHPLARPAQDDSLATVKCLPTRSGEHEGTAAIPGYTVEKELGRAGMRVIYLARENASGNEVALKVLLPQTAQNTHAPLLFQRETEITRDLRHPHLVRVLGSGQAGNVFYFALELCSGGDVSRLMRRRRGKLAVAEGIATIYQTLDGLQHLHEQGIVHRGLGPTKILHTEADHPLVAKLSLSALAKRFGSPSKVPGFEDFERDGEVAGRPHFMPRQQVVNFKCVGPEVDVWAAAACLYNMLTGDFPRDFQRGKDFCQTVLQSEPVSILERNPNIPRPLAEVIDRALIDRPEIVFKSAAALKQALQAAL
jgi:eukaryotic-like serine/threonine-protein kinase